MQRSGYVRFGVALAAALALHAFVLVLLESRKGEIAHSSPLQITIMPQPHASEEAVEKERFERPVTPQNRVAHSNPMSPVIEQREAEDTIAEPEEVARADSAPAKELQLLPQQLQAAIIARVTYPRQARRRGWQGQTELRFEIINQTVHEIRLLSSSGFSILDQAAYTALASIRSMPLHDGPYKLPVIFQLD